MHRNNSIKNSKTSRKTSRKPHAETTKDPRFSSSETDFRGCFPHAENKKGNVETLPALSNIYETPLFG